MTKEFPVDCGAERIRQVPVRGLDLDIVQEMMMEPEKRHDRGGKSGRAFKACVRIRTFIHKREDGKDSQEAWEGNIPKTKNGRKDKIILTFTEVFLTEVSEKENQIQEEFQA